MTKCVGKRACIPSSSDPESHRQRGIRTDELFAEALRANGLVDDPHDASRREVVRRHDVETVASPLPCIARVILVSERTHIALLETPPGRFARLGPGPRAWRRASRLSKNCPMWSGGAHDAGLTVTPWTFSIPRTMAAIQACGPRWRRSRTWTTWTRLTDNPY